MTDGTRDPIKVMVSSETWLKTYGLNAHKLDMKHILLSIGFKKKSDRVNVLRKEVSAKYSEGLFPLFQDRDGSLYNICCGESRLLSVKRKLINQIHLYRERLDWISSGSQHVFGIVEETSTVIVIDALCGTEVYLKALQHDLVHWIEEQLGALGKVNIIWCGRKGFVEWQESVCTPNESLFDWVIKRNESSQSEDSPLYDRTVVTEAVLRASRDVGAQSVYLVTNGEFLKSGENMFVRKVKSTGNLLHLIAYNYSDKSCLSRLQAVARHVGGRIHVYPSICPGFGSSENRSEDHEGSRPPAVICEDVQLLFAELQKASDILAEIAALYEDVKQEKQLEMLVEAKMQYRADEMSMSSKEWLEKYSVKAKHLQFQDLVSTVSFRHCEAVVDVKRAPLGGSPDSPAVSGKKVVQAKYCGRFAHVRWTDGSVRHVFLSEFAYEQHRLMLLKLLDKYRTRLAWLKKGSRELFGTLVEDCVTFLIDTSSSMENHLDIVKDKFNILVQEQLAQKSKFNVVRFGSQAEGWRPELMEVTPQNIALALDWVNSLSASGSTNVHDALLLALKDLNAQAIYLLTDGRPDHPPDQILSHFQHRAIIPVHPISFNCDDPEANQFLFKLAGLTGGRYHFYSDERRPVGRPRPYESEDVRLLREELEVVEEELERLDELREECFAAEKRLSSLKQGREPQVSLLPKLTKSDSTEVESSHRKGKSKKLPPLSLSSKKWLKKHGLEANRLTLLSVLQPTFIKHNASHVEILNKSIESKVFDSILPVSHVSGDGKDVKLVNPQSVNLPQYEMRLKEAMAAYEKRLDAIAWKAIPLEIRNELGLAGDPPSFRNNRDVLMKCLLALDSPRIKQDVSLLDAEIDRALVYLRQSEALRLTTKKKSIEAEPRTVPSSAADTEHSKRIGRFLKSHRVLARDEVTGYYFQGIVAGMADPHHAEVDFDGGFSQTVNCKHLVEIGGAQPCSSLRVGECVLCEVSRPIDLEGDGNFEVAVFSVPGVVVVQPQLHKKPQLYTTFDCFNKKVSSPRSKLYRISRKLCNFAVRYIHSAEARNKRSAQIDLFPSKIVKAPEAESEETPEVTQDRRPESPALSLTSQRVVVSSSPEAFPNPQLRSSELMISSMESQSAEMERFAETLNKISLSQERLKELIDAGEKKRMKSDGEVRQLIAEQGRVYAEIKQKKEVGFRELDELVRKGEDQLKREQEQLRKGQESLYQAQSMEKEALKKAMADAKSVVKADKEIQTVENEERERSPAVNQLLPPLNQSVKENPNGEAVLVSSGNNGFLISRLRQGQAPEPVQLEPPRPPVLVHMEVLSRWPFDGWYYRGIVVYDYCDGTFIVDDSTGDMERLARQYLITDEEDRNKIIQVNDCVVGLHPDYSLSYAPGRVFHASPDGWTLSVEFYDGKKGVLARDEVYWLSPGRYAEDFDFVVARESSWIKQTVFAKRDEDGLFYPGTVEEKVDGCRQYVIKWVNIEGSRVQDMRHLFGPFYKVRKLEMGDRILASPDKGLHYLPGWICAVFGDKISVNFFNGQEIGRIDAASCFWISQDYYDESVQHINQKF